MPYKILTFIIISGLLLSGCSEGLMTLKNLSDEQNEQKAYVQEQERLFRLLEKDLTGNRLKKGTPKEEILNRYSEPIFCRQAKDSLPQEEECLFRHPTDYFSSDFIYLYFDKHGFLQSWEKRCPKTP